MSQLFIFSKAIRRDPAVEVWMNEHPGDDTVLLQAAVTDATEVFTDIGHSLYAAVLLEESAIESH